MHKVNPNATERIYCGYDNEVELSLNGCIFRAAEHLLLVLPGETGLGWNKEQICDLSDRIRISIESGPTMLDALPNAVRVKLYENWNRIGRGPVSRLVSQSK